MKTLPVTEQAAIIRTDFSEPKRWNELQGIASSPADPFVFTIDIVDDASFEGKGLHDLLALVPEDYPHSFVFVADRAALKEEGFPCLVVDLLEQRGRSFRALARELASIENNLSIANMGFEEFAESVNENGVFVGFE